jgi:hypothetical protein
LDDRGLTSEGRPTAALAVVFAAIAVLTTLDLGFDASGGPKVLHILVEGAVSLAGLVGAAVMARRLWLVVRQGRDAQREAAALAERLKATEAEAARWRSEARDHIEGLKRGSGPSVRPLGALPGREGSRSAAAQRIEPQGAGGGSLDHGGHRSTAGPRRLQEGGSLRPQRLGRILPRRSARSRHWFREGVIGYSSRELARASFSMTAATRPSPMRRPGGLRYSGRPIG